MTQDQQELTRDQLKIMALRERLSQVVVEYEDRDADRRVDITQQGNEMQKLAEENARLNNQLQELQEAISVQDEPLADDTNS
jgi:hypothetical protein